MPTRGFRPLVIRRFTPALAGCVAALAGLDLALPRTGVPALAAAQSDTPPLFSGRDFADVRFPEAPRDLSLSFIAARGWSWRDADANRLLLERDVRVVIGPHRFVADRACVWLQPNPDGTEQLGVYLDNARDPAAAGDDPRAPGHGALSQLSQSATRLLVTAVLLPRDGNRLSLSLDLPLRDQRPSDPFVFEAEARLARHLARLTGAETDAPAEPRFRATVRPPGMLVRPDDATPGSATVRTPENALAAETDPLPPDPGPPPTGLGGRDLTLDTRPVSPIAPRTAPAAPREGLVELFSPDNSLVELEGGPDANAGAARALIMSGGVSVQYDTLGRRQSVQLTAQRAVVYLASSDNARAQRYSADDVLGIYLEGDVQATVRTRPEPGASGLRPDQYVLRGSRVYYDIRRNSAVVLDAVFWTYDAERGMPLYLRADLLRQKSLEEFSAEKATLANVGFAEPHFAVGASSVTITRRPASSPGGAALNSYNARDVVFTAGGVPLAYLPRVSGEFKPSPLRRVEFERNARSNVVRTVWDMYTILGLDAPKGNRWDLLIDGYLDRGPGVGTDLRFTRTDIDASALAYYIHDVGKDHLSSGADRDPPKENRGLLLGDAIWRLDEHWTLFAQGAHISDEAFIDSFFRREAQTRREFTTSLYIRRVEGSEAFTAEVRGTLQDFIANQYLLESLGYQRQKLPEFQYFRVGEDLLDGLISYTGEARYSAESLVFDDRTLRTHGYDTRTRAGAGFGLLPDDRLSRALAAQGFNEDTVSKFDTRHDVEIPLAAGPITIVPFAVGRFTAYDTAFSDFNPGEDQDRERYWGSVGVRAAASATRTLPAFESEALDLHGLRHIFTPSATAWSSGSNIDQADLPLYDEGIESLATGSVIRVGMTNTIQTHRPGTSPGARGTMRSVDWLRVTNDYVWSSDDADVESPFGRFIEARPERSNLGEFLANDAVLQLTDAVAITADVLYDTRSNTNARTTAGAIIDHGFGFSTFAEFRLLDQLSSRYLDVGARYELTRKYALTAEGVYDLDLKEFQSLGGRLTRRFPQWTVEVGFHVNTVTDSFGFGFVFSPVGASGESRARVFTREFDDIAPTPRQRDAARDRLDDGPFAD